LAEFSILHRKLSLFLYESRSHYLYQLALNTRSSRLDLPSAGNTDTGHKVQQYTLFIRAVNMEIFPGQVNVWVLLEALQSEGRWMSLRECNWEIR
jgi:hypothetical protein